MSARKLIVVALGAMAVSCNSVLGIGEPETDPGLTTAPWPTRGTSAPGPTKWVPVHYTSRGDDNKPQGPELRFSTAQKAQLLSQVPSQIDSCAPCADNASAGFLLRVYTDGQFADRLNTCDALANCLGTVLTGNKLDEAPNEDVLVLFVPR